VLGAIALQPYKRSGECRDASAAYNSLYMEQRINVCKLRPQLMPVEFQFFGDQHGKRGRDALAQLWELG
jgi:hypothetical protein